MLRSLFAGALSIVVTGGGLTAWAGEGCCTESGAACAGQGYVFRYLSLGGHLLDVSHLNSTLNRAGLDDFKTYAVSFGVGRDWSVRRLVMDHELQGLFWRDRVAGNTRSSFWAGYGLANTGINVLPPGGRFSVYPLVGIGFGVYKLDLMNDKRTFNDAVTGAMPASMLLQGTFLLNAGAGVDVIRKSDRMCRVPGIGLRVGYTWDPTRRTQWWSDGTTVTGGPAPLLTGPYARLVIGMGRPLHRFRHHEGDASAAQTML